jgi:hypothetical protein
MKLTGEVLWYKHAGYKDGSVSWQGPVQIAAELERFHLRLSADVGNVDATNVH